jgi:hypothetical protein
MVNSMSIREYLSTDERALPLEAAINPGFVHKRRIQTILGSEGMCLVDELIQKLPSLPDWQREVRIDHIYKTFFSTSAVFTGFLPSELDFGSLRCIAEHIKKVLAQ